jgi:hypothetical protein
MRIRLQYSLLTLLVLTTVCAVVIVYVIVPWRYRVRQEEIWTRLQAKANAKTFSIRESESGGYSIHLSDKGMVRFLLDNMEDCERITSIGLEKDCFSDKDLQQFDRLKKLRRISLGHCMLSQHRMQILSELPLTELSLRQLICKDFQHLTLPRTLKHLFLDSIYGWHHFPAKPEGDPWPRTFVLDQLPELESLHFWMTGTRSKDTTIQLGDMPRLKRLLLLVDHPAPESRIGTLPSVEDLHISQGFWPKIRQQSLSQLKKLSLAGRDVPFELTDLKKILLLPHLEELQLSIEISALEAGMMVIPELPHLRKLTLNSFSIDFNEQQIPSELLTKILLRASALESMFVSVDKIDADLLAAIASRPLVRELRIESRQCQASLAVLGKCDKLQQLYLQFPLRNEHLLQLNQLPYLTELYLKDDENDTLDFKLLKQRENWRGEFNNEDLPDLIERSADSSNGKEQAN